MSDNPMKVILDQMRRDAEEKQRQVNRDRADYLQMMRKYLGMLEPNPRPLIVVKHKGGPIT